MRVEIHPLRLLIKALLLFVIANVLFAVFEPPIDKLSVYNSVFPGRVRFPFSEEEGSYSVMIDDLDVMASSHVISAPKSDNEIRVVIVGDSSIWGEGVAANESLGVVWNGYGYTCAGKQLQFYNLAYPHPSAVKDLIILDKAMEYQPDIIVWFITLNTLTPRRLSPFIQANSAQAERMLIEYNLKFEFGDESTATGLAAFYNRTLIGRRSEIARWLRLQSIGVIWETVDSGNFQFAAPPVEYINDLDRNPVYKGYEGLGSGLEKEMMMGALSAGHDITKPLPVLIVNEPIFMATGSNSDVRYNVVYPRWAYDYYRTQMEVEAQKNQWNYLDLWNAVPSEYFTDGSLHISSAGQRVVIQQTTPILQSIACP